MCNSYRKRKSRYYVRHRRSRKNKEFVFSTLDFGEFLFLLANYQNEEQDDYDELNLAFQLFDSGI